MEVGNNSVETHVVSQVSKIKAANGDPNLSSETLKAIQEGAVPPQVVRPKETVEVDESTRDLADNIREAATETADIQSEVQSVVVDDAVIVELSNVAASLTQETAEVPAAPTTEKVTEEQPEETQEVVSAPVTTNPDTASVALGNAVDIEA